MAATSALAASRYAMTMLLSAVILIVSAVAGSEAQTSPRMVVLDAPGALGALQRSNPAHSTRSKILDGLYSTTDDVPRWMKSPSGRASLLPVVLVSTLLKAAVFSSIDPYEAMVGRNSAASRPLR